MSAEPEATYRQRPLTRWEIATPLAAQRMHECSIALLKPIVAQLPPSLVVT